jgi:hypothetical protein
MNTPRTDALLEDIEACADAIDWAENPTDTQLISVINLCRKLETELINLKADNLKD